MNLWQHKRIEQELFGLGNKSRHMGGNIGQSGRGYGTLDRKMEEDRGEREGARFWHGVRLGFELQNNLDPMAKV